MHALSTLDLVLWVVACLCFLAAAFNVVSPRVQLGWLGLCFAGLTFLI